MSDHRDYEIGRGKPPVATRFPPGTSGNPRGRPKGKSKASTLPHETVLGQDVSVVENGVPRTMPADAAFLLAMMRKGMTTSSGIGSHLLRAIERSRASRPALAAAQTVVLCVYSEPGQVDRALRTLGMARLLDPFHPTARMALEPWLVEEALERLGERRLTPVEQQIVFTSTRLPHKVRWPDWWSCTAPAAM